MDKSTFREHLDTATVGLVKFTGEHCFNKMADNYKYIITPSLRKHGKGDEYLTEKEIAVLDSWNAHENEALTAGQIVDLLHHQNQVPDWIDITVYESREDVTIIDLLCSRRLRDDVDLLHQGPVVPFHLLVPLPPDLLKVEKDGKFDVNWQTHPLRIEQIKRNSDLK